MLDPSPGEDDTHMLYPYVSAFLQTMDDQSLANLHACCEDGLLQYALGNHCLLGHHQLGYEGAKRLVCGIEAEHEFLHMGQIRGDSDRRQNLLPLIVAEWARRDVRPNLTRRSTEALRSIYGHVPYGHNHPLPQEEAHDHATHQR